MELIVKVILPPLCKAYLLGFGKLFLNNSSTHYSCQLFSKFLPIILTILTYYSQISWQFTKKCEYRTKANNHDSA